MTLNNLASALREKAYAILMGLYILSGRWGFDRLFKDDDSSVHLQSIFELRFLIGPVLFALMLSDHKQYTAADKTSDIRKFIYILNFFFIYMIATAFWSPDSSYAVPKVCDIALVLVMSISVYEILAGGRAQTVCTKFWAFIFFMTGMLALIGLAKAIYSGPERLAVLGGGPNVFGRMMGLLCISSLFFWKRQGRSFFILTSVLSVVLVILSGSRGSMISVGLAVITFFLVERVKVKKMAVFGVISCIILGIIFAYTAVGKKALESYQLRVGKLLLEEGYTSGRGVLYYRAYKLGLEKPIFGAGLAAFPGLGLGVYPHNFFLEIFCEGGIVGLAAIMFTFLFLLRYLWKNRENSDGATSSALIMILAASQISGDFYDSRGLFIFMLMAFLPKDARGFTSMKKPLAGFD